MNVRLLFIALISCWSFAAIGQQTDLLMGRWHACQIEQKVIESNQSVHISSRPVVLRRDVDSLNMSFLSDSSKFYSQLNARIMRDHLFTLRGRDYRISGDVLVDYSAGKEFRPDSAEYLFTGLRGFVIQAEIGKKFSFNSGFYEVQNTVPEYLNLFAEKTGVLPGWGRVKYYNAGDFDFSRSFGRMSFDLFNSFQLHFGYGNHFIGNGYRSLLLTDGVMNSPYLEVLWKSRNGVFQYRTWYTTMQTLERLPLGDTPESLFKKKNGHFHYLSIKPLTGLEIGIFEGMVSKRYTDSTIVKPGIIDFQPLILMNTLLEGWDGARNVYAGVNLSYCFKRIMLYGQLLIDDPASKRMGSQFGIKYYDFMLKGFQIQLEWNKTAPFTYAARKDLTGLNQFNQPLGHPLGGGVQEILGIMEYRFHRYFGRLKYNNIVFDSGDGGSWESQSVTDNERITDYIYQLDGQIGMQLNLQTNAEIYFSYTYRDGIYNSNFIMFGLRTNLHNNYFDF